MSTTKRTAYDKYLALLEKSASVLNLDPVIYKRLQVPELLVRGTVKIEMDDGSFQQFNVFRCQHNHTRGPTQGGTRFDVKVCEAEVKFLAAMMSMKNTIVAIRNGGGKGGICVDKFKLSMQERERLCRGYIRVIAPYIGEYVDGPAPDVNTGADEMSWFLDEYERIVGHHACAQFTGKPLVLGGSEGRGDATALGAVYASEELMKKLGMVGQQTIAIQGFGNAGDFYAKLMSKRGHKIISVSDRSGVIYKKDGFDYADLHTFCYENGVKRIDNEHKVIMYPHKDALTSEEAELLSLSANIFAPAAFEDKIDAKMARKIVSLKKIQAKDWKHFIVELANGPCTEEADAIFAEYSIEVLPDFYASAGGVGVSSLEKTQGLENFSWTAQEVAVWLENHMRQGFKNLDKVREEYHLKSLREAGIVYAVREIADGMKRRGGVGYGADSFSKTVDVPTVTVYKDLNIGSYKLVTTTKVPQ